MKILSKICLSMLIALFYTSAVARTPYEQHDDRGMIHASAGDFAKAKVEFEKAQKARSPDFRKGSISSFYLGIIDDVMEKRLKRKAAMHIFNGKFYSKRYKYNYVIREYSKAIRLNPRYSIAYSSRAHVYLVKGQYHRAVRDYTLAIKFNPKNNAGLYIRRGKIYYKWLKKRARACADWRKACELGWCEFHKTAKRTRTCP